MCSCKNNKCSKYCKDEKKNEPCDNDNQCQSGGSKTKFKIDYYKPVKGGFGVILESIDDLSNWIYQEGYKTKDYKVKNGPVKYYKEIVKRYGKPNILVNQPGGLCIWNVTDKKDAHLKLELKDEYVSHCVPAQHYDFFYSYIKIYIEPEILNDILSISGSINYDPLKKELFARCGSFEANYATLRTVFDTINKSNSNYKKNIISKDNEKLSNKEFVTKETFKNQKKYKKELDWPYYSGAFPNGCEN